MEQNEFRLWVGKYGKEIEAIRESAHAVHAGVNQAYDKVHPYGVHLDMVADAVAKYGGEVCVREEDVLPLFFGAYYHDSIEDARMSYNDVMRTARQWMDEEQARLAAEIVYALTNEKGRTRAERANEKYYEGIRETPYAPFVKLADRLANFSYSVKCCNEMNAHMKEVYIKEFPHFLAAIDAKREDVRFGLPKKALGEIERLATLRKVHN
jgi:5'-deoxynucleotidase YfbR-like HD superfamily hydrolase